MPHPFHEANKIPKAGPDEVYSQLYHEMRRHRDYELTTSTWHMLLLLGVLGGVYFEYSLWWESILSFGPCQIV